VREQLRFSHGVFDGGKSGLEALRAGDVDAAAMDGPAAEVAVAASRGALVLVEGNLGPERYALALPKDSELGEDVDRALGVLRERGDLDLLDRRHGL
jgi:ABC-type amino acid transport substrate-binding protein